MGLVVLMMMRLAALTVSCLSALVADGRPTQTACGAIDPNGQPAVASGRPTQTACGAIDPNGRPTVANGRPAQTPCPSSPSERSIHFGQGSREAGQARQRMGAWFAAKRLPVCVRHGPRFP